MSVSSKVMTPSIQHYHVEVDIGAIEVSLTHNCPHLTQDTFNLYFRTVWSWPESAGSPSAFSSTSGRGRTFLCILDTFQSSLAASHLILFILAGSLEVPHLRDFLPRRELHVILSIHCLTSVRTDLFRFKFSLVPTGLRFPVEWRPLRCQAASSRVS